MDATGMDGPGTVMIVLFLGIALLCINPSILLFLVTGAFFFGVMPMSSPTFREPAVIQETQPVVPHSYLQNPTDLLNAIAKTWRHSDIVALKELAPSSAKWPLSEADEKKHP